VLEGVFHVKTCVSATFYFIILRYLRVAFLKLPPEFVRLGSPFLH
jgi:hypothetical protein